MCHRNARLNVRGRQLLVERVCVQERPEVHRGQAPVLASTESDAVLGRTAHPIQGNDVRLTAGAQNASPSACADVGGHRYLHMQRACCLKHMDARR